MNRLYGKNIRLPQNNKEWLYLILTFLLVLFFYFYENNLANNLNIPTSHTSVDVSAFNGKNFDIFDDFTHVPVKFVKASDGDTVTLKINNIEFRARYLMINTPEIGDSPQAYALEARSRNSELIKAAKQVTITFDKGNHSDHYDRALVYLWIDGQDIAEILLSEGLASVDYVYPPNNSFENKYRQLENEAKAQKLGIWQ